MSTTPSTTTPRRPRTRAQTAAPTPAPIIHNPKGKLGALVGPMRRPQGTTLVEMMAASGWQAHSVRGAIAGTVKKKLGLTVETEKPGGERVYRIVTPAQP
ncbi:MAG: hypothetical protein JWQ97_3346 [Phenylobacterium sp.]|nr:hypothetical protein [Phenylobacterium sp.]